MDLKVSECQHGLLRNAYQMQTNFKNVEAQVSCCGFIVKNEDN